MTLYSLAKTLHILIAILALGTSAGLGIILEFYGDDPIHGGYVLRAIQRLVALFVIPGYLLMLVTGLWLTGLAWSLATRWIEAALALWGVGLACLVADAFVLARQVQLFESHGPATPRYRRVSLLGRALGAVAGLIVILILVLMVAKPGLDFQAG